MKSIFLFISLVLIMSCSSKQKLTNKSSDYLQNISCPESGNCSFEILKDSKLTIKTDDFGKLYPEIVSGSKLVIKYQFAKKNKKENLDSNYSEFIYFEIDANAKYILLKDSELQKVKMLFGRICHCGRATGYFKVTKGELLISNKNRNLQLKSSFQVGKVPQIISEINEHVKY